MRAVLCGALLVIAGCATVIRGSSQEIRINTTPAGAEASAGAQTVTTPGTLDLARERTHTVEIRKAGYVTARRCVAPRQDGAVYGNLALGGIIGMLVDMNTGAIYSLDPHQMEITLLPEDPGTADH